jgi:hypothetical protein
MGLRERIRLVGEEHDPELADDGIEHSVREGQLHGVRLTPFHRSRGPERRCPIEHRLIQIGRDDRGVFRECGRQGTRHDTGAGRDFQHAAHGSPTQPGHQVRGVWLEQQRNEIRLVELRDRATKDFVAAGTAH